MHKILPKNKLSEFIKILQKRYQVYIPQKKNGDYVFVPSENDNITDLKPSLTTLPPKKLFYPQKETLFEFINNTIKKPKNNFKPIAILGLTCNDLAGIILLDKVMTKPQKEWYYWQRRNRSLLIGVGSRRINIDDQEYDLFLEERKNDYLVISSTASGKEILRSVIFKKTDLDPKPIIQTIDPLFANKEQLSKVIKASSKDKIWDRLEKICFGCGICAYVCPVCYCFDIADKINLESKDCPTTCQLCSGKRERTWTACILADFAQVAGGHNFRENLRDRIYNWYHHKFVRFPLEFNTVGCVSCGRCIRYCPARINFRKVLEEVLVKYS